MTAKILVVDDEPDLEHLIQQKFRRKIRNKEYEFYFAQNGTEALNVLQRHPEISLVLSDINMPEMDGLTLLSKLGELELTLRAVIVSAYGDMENIRKAMNRGAFDFITKPIDLQDLETTIEKTLRDLNLLKKALQARDQLVAIRQELDVATRIQTSLLPRTFPAFPDRQEFDIHAKMITAKEVGGDFYDFFLIDDNRLGIVIGDVSGKGIPAAIFMAMSRTLIKATALTGGDINTCMADVNKILNMESVPTMFVTAFYGILNIKTGEFEYCNAGHNLPILMKPGDGVEQLPNIGGVMLGAFPGLGYESNAIKLASGETLILYTDGVTEAIDRNEEEFGEIRLEQSLAGQDTAPLDVLVQRIIDELQAFASEMPQADDVTILALRYQS